MSMDAFPDRHRSTLRGAARGAAVLVTGLVLLASYDPPPAPRVCVLGDSAPFDAATSCGPAGRVTLRTEAVAGCTAVVHADGGPAVGIPSEGSIEYTDGADADYPGDSLLRARITLEGPVALPDAVPATTVSRTCRTVRTSRNVLSVACEGTDPEAACSGILSIGVVTP